MVAGKKRDIKIKRLRFGLSLVETLVLLVVVSVIIAAITPLVTRKAVNNINPGTTIGGASHGRYECYTDSSGSVRERMYSGSTVVYDKAASSGKCKFTPPKSATNFVIYAVGGGGAGGGSGQNFITSYVPSTKTEKLDVRTGSLFPQDVMLWTSKLGSQTQNAVTSPMPAWFNWDTLDTTKNNRAFNFAIVGCGGAGGDGGDATWQSSCDYKCLRDKYMGGYNYSCKSKVICPQTCLKQCMREVPEICHVECLKYSSSGECIEERYSEAGYECGITNEWWNCGEYDCSYDCCTYGVCSGAWCSTDYTYYTGYNIKCGGKNEITKGGSCGKCADINCPNVAYKRTTNPYYYVNSGGSGGAAPSCAGLQVVIANKVNGTLSGSGGDGSKGGSANLGNIGAICSATKYGTNSDGSNGGSYTITIDKGYAINNNNGKSIIGTAYSIGGRGGSRFTQDQYWITLFKSIQTKFLSTVNLSSLVSFLNSGVLSSQPTNSAATEKFLLGSSLACNALNGPGAADGEDGQVRPSAAKCGGSVARGAKCSTGIYSEVYTWKTPYATKYLGYGESGNPGNYETLKIATISGPLDITLGRGGKWTNNDWQIEGVKSTGPDGTNTVVGNILVAKGGEGGKGSLKTNRYELCHMLDKGKESKCNKDIRNTNDLDAVKEKLSGFSTIGSSLVGNSSLLSSKYGKGGLGGGSQSNAEYVCGIRNVINTSSGTISTGLSEIIRTIYDDTGGSGCPSDANGYKNVYMPTVASGLSGGDGAVIITW